MADDKTYPYATHVNVLHAPLELIDVQDGASTRAPERSIVRMVEAGGVVPTGD